MATTAFALPAALQSELFRLRIPSDLEWIGPTVEFLRQRAVQGGVCDESRGRKLALALHEALTNSVVHGNLEVESHLKEQGDAFAQLLAERGGNSAYCGRTVSIGVDFDGASCRWTFRDQGKGFDVAAVLSRLEPTEENLGIPSGRGILLMRAFLDDVEFQERGRCVVLTLRRAFPRDQRLHPRIPSDRPVRVAPIRADGSVDWEAARECLSRDLSESGVALLHKDLARVDRIMIAVDLDGRTLYIPAEIRHWRPLDSGMIEIGCRFLFDTAPELAATAQMRADVQAAVGQLLQPLEPAEGPPDERRAYPRVHYAERIGLEGPTAADPRFAYARDLSKGGIAFITNAPVTRETKVLLLPRAANDPLRVRARIVRCDKVAEGFYDVGASFEALEG